jgi:hypothetical protein
MGAMKASEYGGSDTDKTDGIQPAPHVLTASEKLRLLHKTNEDDAGSGVELEL